MYSNQEPEEGGGFGGGGFDLGFFGGLLHSPLGNLVYLCHSLHPSLHICSRSLHPSLRISPPQHLLVLLGGYGDGSVLLLCRSNLIDDTRELPIPANLKSEDKILTFKNFSRLVQSEMIFFSD